jgi:hypothetical protein
MKGAKEEPEALNDLDTILYNRKLARNRTRRRLKSQAETTIANEVHNGVAPSLSTGTP